MGLFDFVSSQFIEVIEWLDADRETMVYRFPVKNQEIKMGAKLTVRESQVAIFVNEGQVADVFQPGLYTLDTANMPILTKLKSWKYGFNSPFKAEVYFVNTKQFTDQKWGTSNPVMLRDPDFGMIRLRGFGAYSFKVSDPVVFLKEVFGTNEGFETSDITGHLKRIVVSGLTDLIGESKIAAMDLAANYDELSDAGKKKFQPKFNEFGFELSQFFIENLSLPKEVEEAMDKRTSMGVLGDANRYMQFQAADALKDAAKNPGNGMAGMGVGLGAGHMMGQMMGQSFNNMQQNNQNNAPVQNNEPKAACPACNIEVPAGSKFCPECGGKIVASGKANCISCNAEIDKDAKFCPECGSKQSKACSNCGVELSAGAKFCPECGTKSE